MIANRLSGFLVFTVALGFAGCGGESLTLPPSTGNLEITTVTEGSEPDSDGYAVQVDAEEPRAIEAGGTLEISDLAPGAHSVLLSGLAPNCTVAGENPRTLSVVVGETTEVTFTLNCSGTTGALEITTQTTGPAPDADGYAISLDGTDRGPIGTNATVTLTSLPPGSHVVGLTGLAANCAVEGDNLRAVTITTGQTATLTLSVACAQPPAQVGILRITTTTTGPDQDADGYQFTVDGGEPQPIGVNTATNLNNTEVGNHNVVLSDVASNCSVDDPSESVVVTEGATATVAFNITCSSVGPTTGTIRVVTSTSGDNQDEAYQFSIDGGGARSVAANGQETVGNVSPGSHTVVLSGVADNCTVAGGNSRNAEVTAGQTADVTFTVSCSAPPPSASESEVNVSSDRIDTGETTNITVRVRDVNGRRMAGVTVSVTASGGGNQISPPSAVTNSNGLATFSFSSSEAGEKTITATANGVIIDEKPVITVSRRNSTTQITSVTPETSSPGETIRVEVAVAGDGGGTPTGTVAIFSDQEAGGCNAAPVNGGVAVCEFALNVPGTHTIRATYSGDGQFEGSSDPDGEEHLVNAAPTTVGEGYTGTAGAQLVVSDPGSGLLANDRDPEGDATSIGSHSEPSNGTLQLAENGTFIYTPRDGAVTSDMFSYSAKDVKGAVGNQADVTITLNSLGAVSVR